MKQKNNTCIITSLVMVVTLTTGCWVTVNDQTVPSFSTGELCEFLGPKWITLQEENKAIYRELEKRQARCAGGYVVDYGIGKVKTIPRKKGSSSGTGFIVNSMGSVVTNHHVVEDCETLHAVIDHEKVRAKVIAADKTNDVAVLDVNHLTTSFAKFRTPFKIQLAESVMVLGFPLRGLLADQINATTGDITSLAGIGGDTRYLQTSAPIQPGNSGGPILDEWGSVIGVATSKLNAAKVAAVTGDIPQNVNFGVKALMATNLLEANGIAYNKEKRTVKMKKQELARYGAGFVVPILCNNKN